MKTYTVKAGVLERDGKIMIARRKGGTFLEKSWEFPGGKIEVGESPKECLMREFKEELDIVIDVAGCIGKNTHTYLEHDFKVHLELFFINHVDGEFQLHVHDKILWILPSEIGEYDFLGAALPLMGKIKEVIKNKYDRQHL